jgi:hypothetical protein
VTRQLAPWRRVPQLPAAPARHQPQLAQLSDLAVERGTRVCSGTRSRAAARRAPAGQGPHRRHDQAGERQRPAGILPDQPEAPELNDRSHDSARRRARDEFLRQAFAAAGVPLHFVRAAARYDGMPSSAIGRRRCPKIPGAIGIARPSSRKEANDRRTAHHFTLPCSGYVIRPPPWVASATSRPERPALLPRRARVAGHHRPWPTDGRTQRANGSCPTGRRLKGLHTRRFRCSASLLR